MKLVIRFLLLAALVFALPYVVPGISVSAPVVALIVALIFAFINTVVKPVIALLTLPINIISLGLFSFLINVLLFWGISFLVSGFTIAGFIPALIGSVILSIGNWFLDMVF